MSQKVLIAKLVQNHSLRLDDLSDLISNPDPAVGVLLQQAADKTRAKYVGTDVHLRALIEFSNYCRCNCLYCGLRRDNKKTPRYRMKPQEIISAAVAAAELGYGTVVLQSGEDPAYSGDDLAQIIREIRSQTSLAITLSVGERQQTDYALWRQAGAERYLLRHESQDPDHFALLHPGRQLDSRINCLKVLRSLDYEVGSGFMVGLPGQTAQMLARDLLLLQKLDPDMVGIGAFIPSPHTPLGDEAGGCFEQTVRLVALTRLLLPDANIPATTAMGTLESGGQERTLASGANVLMPNLTPEKYRKLYQIYPGKLSGGENHGAHRLSVEERIKKLGRTVGEGAGTSLRYMERSKKHGKHTQSK